MINSNRLLSFSFPDCRLFYVGEHVRFKFLNNEFSMIVHYIKSGSTIHETMDDRSTSDIVESFSRLEISSAGELDFKKDTSVVPKTFFSLVEMRTHLVITHAGPCFTLDSFGGYSPWKSKVLHWVEEVLNGPSQYVGLGQPFIYIN